MRFFLPFVCLLFVSRNAFGQNIQQEWIHDDDEISYQDIVNINASCFPRDSCMAAREDDSLYPSNEYACSCNRECWKFGTCCIDSPHRVDYPPIQECRSTENSVGQFGYYMVHRCPDNSGNDSVWQNMCEMEWNEEDDLSMLSPVTSLDTSTTYKNYYCFRCHETTDKYISWNLFLESNYEAPKEKHDYSVTYNEEYKTWVATTVENPFSIPVNLSFKMPYDKVSLLPSLCNLDMVSDCPDAWIDKNVLDKCLAYTAVLYKELVSYKNAHCALCNNELIERLSCKETVVSVVRVSSVFSFRHLIDINDSSEDKVGKTGKCDDDQLWDPYGKKCRKRTCAVPGYVVMNSRCVLP